MIYLEKEIPVSTVSMQAFLSNLPLAVYSAPIWPLVCCLWAPLVGAASPLVPVPQAHWLKDSSVHPPASRRAQWLVSCHKDLKDFVGNIYKSMQFLDRFSRKKYCLLSQRRKINSIALCHQAD